MKILVINVGSSSIKYKLFKMPQQKVLAKGICQKIGEKGDASLEHTTYNEEGAASKTVLQEPVEGHGEGFGRIATLLTDAGRGPIQDPSEIAAVGHRVVHGGEAYREPVIVDAAVMAAITEYISLAPLHNPPNLKGIKVARKLFPKALQVAVFDTAFHQTMPAKAFLYALPYQLYKENKIRRYGFHGTSHAFVARQAAQFMGKPLEELNLITIHLGNGASVAAIKSGVCVDTSMGMTPLEGLVMGTRSGDIDPALPTFLQCALGLDAEAAERLFNKQSGLLGICGSNDMRTIIAQMKKGEKQAQLAFDIFCYRVKKYIGAYLAVLSKVNGVVFTGGIGENAPLVRSQCLKELEAFGIVLDAAANRGVKEGIKRITHPQGKVELLVIPTNEELEIAIQAEKLCLPDNP